MGLGIFYFMRNYQGFSYQPDYGYELYSNGTLIGNAEKVRAAACFSRVFYDLGGRNQDIFKGTYTLRCRKTFRPRSGNYCSLDKSQINKIMRYMRESFEIGVNLTEDEENYIFIFDVEGKPIKHKFVLTFSRVFFEFPYNEWAKDVLRLRDLGELNGVNIKHMGFLQLFSLVTSTYQDLWGCNHSLFYYPSLEVTIKHLHEVFESGGDRVHNVYAGTEELYKKFKRPNEEIRNLDWENDFENRIGNYSTNFKILRKLKGYDKKGIRRRARKVLQ